jgi:hypothetical protein
LKRIQDSGIRIQQVFYFWIPGARPRSEEAEESGIIIFFGGPGGSKVHWKTPEIIVTFDPIT